MDRSSSVCNREISFASLSMLLTDTDMSACVCVYEEEERTHTQHCPRERAHAIGRWRRSSPFKLGETARGDDGTAKTLCITYRVYGK